jgi:dephospho-CoA kinase
MYRVGLTGGIGAGKTTVARMFEVLGVPVYYSDYRAKKLMTEKSELVARIKEVFSDAAYLWDGQLNRPYLAEVVFHNPEKLHQLNSIVHPALWKDAVEWADSKAPKPYTVQEAAILFETGGYKNMDANVMVYAPLEERIRRTMERDKIDRHAVLARMDKQMPEEKKLELVDHIIYNDGTQSLVSQVVQLHHQLIEKAENKSK